MMVVVARALSFAHAYPPSLTRASSAQQQHRYVKLGQILSIRPDVLPPDVMAELARLQDKIKPFSTAEARAIIEADLGAPIDEIFSEFTEQPIAAASLAQVRGVGRRGRGGRRARMRPVCGLANLGGVSHQLSLTFLP